MICPNDGTEMHPVRIVAHYGQPIVVDQCEHCGGIWFDRSELFQARQGEAERIELLDANALGTPSLAESSKLLCPRDRTAMRHFTDSHFPQDIILVRCFSCYGIWLNRGMFTQYQRFRHDRMQPKAMSTEDTALEQSITQLVASHQSGQASRTIERLARFLSTPLNGYASPSPSYSHGRSLPEHAFSAGLNILMVVLRMLILRH